MSRAFLEEILEYKRGLNKTKADFYASLKDRVKPCAQPHRFKEAVGKPGAVNLIAEIKKASPSRGVIREDFDPVAIAAVYHQHGAAALSVLTEDKHFLGKPEFIEQISELIDMPILTKDFIIEEGQIDEACVNGAGAVLLIVAVLNDDQLERLIARADVLGMDALVEVHTEEELKRAFYAGAGLIGVNNRDLHAFEVNKQVMENIIPQIPRDKVIVAESGLKTHADIQEAGRLGAQAVLIGETFMQAEDIGRKIEEVMHGQS